MSEVFPDFKLPDSWTWAKSKQIGEVINGDRGKNYPSRQHYVSIGVPFLSAGNLSEGKIDLESLNFITEDKFNCLNNGKLEKGDIIYCLRGTLGKCAPFELAQRAAVASSLAILRPVKEVNSKFLIFYLQSPFGKKLIKHFDNGTAQPNLSGESFSNYDFPIPPLPEQHHIVAKIEELFSSLDKGIESLKTAQTQLKTYRQAVLKWAFEGKLTNKNVIEGELPEGWKWIEIKEIVTELNQGWSPKCSNEKSFSHEEWAVIKTTAIQHGYFLGTENKILPSSLSPRKQHELKNNDILITRAGPRVRVGVCCLVKNVRPKLLNCDKAYRILANESKVVPGFLVLALNSPTFLKIIDKCKSGGNDSGLNLTQNVFLSISIPIPPTLNEQHRIVAEIESRLSVCDKLEETISQSLSQAEALRQSILKKAFAGKLVPQDPNDESASVLLERIQLERQNTEPVKKTRNTKKKAHAQRNE